MCISYLFKNLEMATKQKARQFVRVLSSFRNWFACFA